MEKRLLKKQIAYVAVLLRIIVLAFLFPFIQGLYLQKEGISMKIGAAIRTETIGTDYGAKLDDDSSSGGNTNLKETDPIRTPFLKKGEK